MTEEEYNEVNQKLESLGLESRIDTEVRTALLSKGYTKKTISVFLHLRYVDSIEDERARMKVRTCIKKVLSGVLAMAAYFFILNYFANENILVRSQEHLFSKNFDLIYLVIVYLVPLLILFLIIPSSVFLIKLVIKGKSKTLD
jgi:hypothetical protein